MVFVRQVCGQKGILNIPSCVEPLYDDATHMVLGRLSSLPRLYLEVLGCATNKANMGPDKFHKRSPSIPIHRGELKHLGVSGAITAELPFLAQDEAKTTSDRYLTERALIAAQSLFDVRVGMPGGGTQHPTHAKYI